MDWQKDGACAKKENKDLADFFFSTKPEEKYQAKNLCFDCPVRDECLKWALENKQIWGIWGGRDEGEIRRTLSVSWDGRESRRQRFPQCPYCTARPTKLTTKTVDVPNGGRWKTARMVECTECGFEWRSRTSANAVDAYHVDREEKQERAKKLREKKKERELKKKSRTRAPKAKPE
jgi:WhiB family redox-sensing transcriptional regulator